MTADEVIRRLDLQPHPVEGGFFRETYRSPHFVRDLLSAEAGTGVRTSCAADGRGLSLLSGFAAADAATLARRRREGRAHRPESPQVVVPGGVWQGSRLEGDTGFATVGCTMAPPFEYSCYRNASRAELCAKWPAFAEEIARLTPRG